MRILGYPVVVAALVATSYPLVHGQAVDASQVLALVREALGGEKNLSAVRSFTATGRTRQVRGNNLVPIEFEIYCELPDKFVRRDEFPGQETDPTTVGFNGDVLIQFPPLSPTAGAGRAGGSTPPTAAAAAPPADGRSAGGPSTDSGRSASPPLSPAQQRVATIKQDFVRLTLGMFAASFSTYPLTFRYAGVGQAPEGQADVLDLAGPTGFSARLVVQRDTHLPVMLMWSMPATTVVVRAPDQPVSGTVPPGTVVVDAPTPPASTASQEERTEYAATVATLRRQALAQAKPVEYRMYYADFREVSGLKWPYRIRRAIGGETVEEMTLDRIRINTTIDPKKFEATK